MSVCWGGGIIRLLPAFAIDHVQEFEAVVFNLREKNAMETTNILMDITLEHVLRIRQGVDNLDISGWNVVLIDQAVVYLASYISVKWPDVPVVVHMSIPLIIPSMKPQWPYPTLAECSDNMTFIQRLVNTLIDAILEPLILWVIWGPVRYDKVMAEALKEEDNPYSAMGIAFPVISTTTFGFEFPRPLLPMVHLTGPHLIKAVPPIGEDLEQWLGRKREKKVVYISMGSAAFLTKEMGEGLIEGITAAGYDAVWSLRESNQDILEGIELDRERFYVSSWISQQAVLQHKAIGIAILHGGMNGVHEAIYYRVAVIVIPFGMDQTLVASKIHHQQLGVRLFSADVTAERVATSIHAVVTGDYRERVEKLNKIFRFVGGTKKAADILEHYADVGYDHLSPAFYKYKWSWVQYYNADVYALLIGILVVTAYCFYRIMKFTCGKCFGSKSKTD